MSTIQIDQMYRAIEGYTELGMVEQAWNLLENLPPNLKATQMVINLQIKLFVRSQKYAEAAALAEELSMSDPADVDQIIQLAYYHYKAGHFQNALSWLQTIKAKCQNNASYHCVDGMCWAALGDNESANSSLQKATALAEIFETNLTPTTRPRFLN